MLRQDYFINTFDQKPQIIYFYFYFIVPRFVNLFIFYAHFKNPLTKILLFALIKVNILLDIKEFLKRTKIKQCKCLLHTNYFIKN